MSAQDKVLKGHRILITREYSADYELLEDQGADLFVFPTIQAVPPADYRELDRVMTNLRTYDWLVFTSRNGVHFFFKRLLESGCNIEGLSGLRICAVGPGTAHSLGHYGLKADVIPKRFSAEGLVETFAPPGTVPKALQGVSFLFPRAEAAREIFPHRIRELGGVIDSPVVYRTIVPPLKAGLRESVFDAGITIATFTSGSTFTNFLQITGQAAIPFLSRVAIAAIGPVTRQGINETGLKVAIMPSKATIEAMVNAILEWAAG